jgi:PIN domain nuclease of toxin-antitoxin system
VRILVDTHVWLWMLTAPERLGDARSLAADADTELYLSAASSWEITIKYRLGRLPLPEPPAIYVPSRMHSTRVRGLPVEHRHALAVADLPPHHRDPFDRLLITQAVLEQLTLLTADPTLRHYDADVLLLER